MTLFPGTIMTVLFILGTRPEAIKLAPLITVLRDANHDVKVCVTGQHRELLDQVLNFFMISPDYDLNIMKKDQTLFDIAGECMRQMQKVLDTASPELIFVQGDTTTAFIGALAGYYHRVPVAHIEAGLRSYNKYSPYPEEINRKLISVLADYHFAPTPLAVSALAREGIKRNVWNVGNTVVDALFLGLSIIEKDDRHYAGFFNCLHPEKRTILITAHRRESFGGPFDCICKAIRRLAAQWPDVQFVFPLHLNPRVKGPALAQLSGLSNVHLFEPLDYPKMLWLMKKSYLILTDSGGIQEEAPSLGKPVLVLREVTERTESVDAGISRLVGTDEEKIYSETSRLLSDPPAYAAMACAKNPYGDGNACKRIAAVVRELRREAAGG